LNSKYLKVAIAQGNFLLGDLSSNCEKIIQDAAVAFKSGAHLLITPELSLTGYPPEDLLFRHAFIKAVDEHIEHLRKELAQFKDMIVIVGHPSPFNHQSQALLQNCASVLSNGAVIARYAKQFLPNSEVFDEVRYFSPGNQTCVFEAHGTQIGLIICEDIWHEGPAQAAKKAGAELLIIPNASPFHMEKTYLRKDILKKQILDIKIPAIYVNLVGGQDELVFDGASFDGKCFCMLYRWIKNWQIMQRVVRVNILVKSMKNGNITTEIIDTSSRVYGLQPNQIHGMLYDRASPNLTAVQNLRLLFPQSEFSPCISHTITHAGEHF
jgi:predicted amidohydrolase